jgi:hypothetical protein
LLNLSSEIKSKKNELHKKCDLFKPIPTTNIEMIIKKANTEISDKSSSTKYGAFFNTRCGIMRKLLSLSLILTYLLYPVFKFLSALKESKYQIISYSKKLPEPMILILAKQKLDMLRKIRIYWSDMETIKHDNGVVKYYAKLSKWLKVNSLLFQILFDCLLGVLVFTVLVLFLSEVIGLVKYFLFWTEIEKLEEQVKYTMTFLGNFKPIPKLDRYLGELLIEMLNAWDILTSIATQIESYLIIFVIGPIGLLGASFQSALAHDLLALITAHIHSVYFLFAIIYKSTLEMLQTIWYMFRGKKYNMLKNKVDAADYRIEELLFGVLTMTVILFVFPTMLVYYLSLVYLMCFIIIFQTSLIIITQLVSKLPVFMFVWMLSNNKKIPKGFVLVQQKVSVVTPYISID